MTSFLIFSHYAIVLPSAMLLVSHSQALGNGQPPSSEVSQTRRLSEPINDPRTQLAEEVTTVGHTTLGLLLSQKAVSGAHTL